MADDLRSLLASQDIRDAVRHRRYGVVLRRARQARGLTQAQAGELAGYSGATISRFETGTGGWPTSTRCAASPRRSAPPRRSSA